VEPKNGKKIQTLDEILNSDVVFCYNQALLLAKETVAYTEIVKFVDQKKQKEECTGSYSCVERMITKRDMATISSLTYATYWARDLGFVDVGKIICHLDETVVSGSATVLLGREINFWADSTI